MDEQTIADLKHIAATPQGKGFLHYLLIELCGLYSPNLALTQNHDVSTTVLISRESQRSIALFIRDHIPQKDWVGIEFYQRPDKAPEKKPPVTEDETPCPTTRQELIQQQNQQLAEQDQEPEEPAHRHRSRKSS